MNRERRRRRERKKEKIESKAAYRRESKAINAIEITVELNLFPNVKKVFGRWKTIQNVILNGLQS